MRHILVRYGGLFFFNCNYDTNDQEPLSLSARLFFFFWQNGAIFLFWPGFFAFLYQGLFSAFDFSIIVSVKSFHVGILSST